MFLYYYTIGPADGTNDRYKKLSSFEKRSGNILSTEEVKPEMVQSSGAIKQMLELNEASY